jgi:hypothetical protein
VEKLAEVTGMPVAHAQQAAQRERVVKRYGDAMLSEMKYTDNVRYFSHI